MELETLKDLIFFRIIVAGMLLFWHWEAMLISYLAARKTVLPFENVEELVRTSNFRIALHEGKTFYTRMFLLEAVHCKYFECKINRYMFVCRNITSRSIQVFN